MEFEARKFNQESYNENDCFAKDIFKSFLIKRGHKITSDKENFNHDLITELNGLPYHFELEVKIGYPFTSKETFKFSTISFLGRKKRLHDIQPFFYVIICKETGWAVFCKSENIYEEKNIEKVNVKAIDRKGNDEMYRVHKKHCTFFDLN